jgi:hypothetical protein
VPDLSPTPDALVARLGFEREGVDRFSRFGFSFQIDSDSEGPAWRTWAWSLWAARIAVDQAGSKYDVSTERSKRAPRNIYEVPSPYGERERVLLPLAVIEAVGRMAKPLFASAWVDDRFRVTYGLAEGYGVHILGVDELETIPFDRDNVVENARLAHFYASYKARPAKTEKFEDICRVKHFTTVDGKTASRALLFPDFDWDAAQDSGSFFLPGRDHLVVGEPLEFEHAAVADQRAAAFAASLDPQIPFFPTRYRLDSKSVAPKEDAWDDPWESPPADLPIQRLA